MNYPTIVNNIPKDKKVYDNTMDDFALIDDMLANSQSDIGESSNLAQIAQTYACNFSDSKYSDYVCILSVLAQVAIDNAKRRFDIDLTQEIRRIKNDMNIKNYKYPKFWLIIKKKFNKKNINYKLKCPMNKLYDLNISEFHPSTTTLPMSYFFEKHQIHKNDVRRKSTKVEDLIQKYSLNIYNYNLCENDDDNYILIKSSYQNLINDISLINISYNYIGLFSWLLDRAFIITPNIISNSKKISTLLDKNKSILLKVLYDVNKKSLLKCFKTM